MDVLIVESAAKARTLQRYLGKNWAVLATGGHVETLPNDRSRHGKDASKAFWSNRPGQLPTPPWVWTERGEDAVASILDKAGDSPTFWIATDPDREGEFIAWSLERRLEGRGPTHRVTFQEVTEEAVRAALDTPRGVDRRMVESALVRKFLDRLVGFRTSKMANGVVPGRGNSMGRVQTPTLGFVVERELEREAHVPIPYFEVRASALGVGLTTRFHEPDDPEAWRDAADKVHPTRTFDRELAETALTALGETRRVTVTEVKSSTGSRRPSAPFSTDALLQAAGSRFGWSPRKTSALASMLYEAGHITYIRTDSNRLADSAIAKAREVVGEEFGEDHLGPSSGAKATPTTGPVQDAHEAIRPSRLDIAEAGVDDDDARRLYRLIRAHTLASQMAPSTTASRRITVACDGLDRRLTGSVSWRTFAGWEAAYAEFLGDRATEPPSIPLEEGAVWDLDEPTEESPNPLFIEDETRPPSRYRPHTLIKAMKDAGIGRPSTYARTVEKLEERGYVVQEEGALVPTEPGRAIWVRAAPLYARKGDEGESGLELFSPEFTAKMEERLDEMASGELAAPETWERWRDLIRELHEEARNRKQSGESTLQQQDMLQRLLVNAPEPRPVELADIEGLTWAKAQEIMRDLRESGVAPAPTDRQLDYINRLLSDLELSDEERAEVVGTSGVEGLRTTTAASEVIDTLQAIYDERRPPSAKQRRFIEGLIEKCEMSETDAAALVDLDSLDDLTGGREGSASALIDALSARLEAASGDKRAAGKKAASEAEAASA